MLVLFSQKIEKEPDIFEKLPDVVTEKWNSDFRRTGNRFFRGAFAKDRSKDCRFYNNKLEFFN